MNFNINKDKNIADLNISFTAEMTTLIFLFFLAFWLRFSNLERQGFYFWDDGYYAMQARTINTAIRWSLRNPRQILNGNTQGLFDEILKVGGIRPATTAKPTHVALIVLSFLIFGDKDSSSLFISAMFGLFTIFIIYLWGRQRYGPLAGLAGAAFLAGLGGHIWYSRTGLATTDTAFWLVLGSYLFIRLFDRDDRFLLFSSFSLGLAFSSHYNTMFAIMPFFVAIVLSRRWNGILWFVGGFLIPLFVWEGLFQILRTLSPIPLQSYFGELYRQLFSVAGSRQLHLSQAGLFLKWFIASSGLFPTTALFSGALLFAIRNRFKKDIKEFLLLILGVGMLVFWSLYSIFYIPVARPIGNIIPFLCLLAGIGWVNYIGKLVFLLTQTQKLRDFVSISLVLFVMLMGLSQASTYRLCESPYKTIATFLSRGSANFITSCDANLFYYLPNFRKNALFINLHDFTSSIHSDNLVPDYKNIKYAVFDSGAVFATKPPAWLRFVNFQHPLLSFSFDPLEPEMLFLEGIFWQTIIPKAPYIKKVVVYQFLREM